MKRRFVIVDTDADSDIGEHHEDRETRRTTAQEQVEIQEPRTRTRAVIQQELNDNTIQLDGLQPSSSYERAAPEQDYYQEEEDSRAQIGFWLSTGRSPALYSINTDSNSNSHSINNDDQPNPNSNTNPNPTSPAATSDELFLPRRITVPIPDNINIAGPSRGHARDQQSDSDSSVLTAKYIRSVRNEMPAKGVSSKRRRKSNNKPLKENPTFFARGPAELDPDERLSRLRKSLSLIGPVNFANPLKESNNKTAYRQKRLNRSAYTLPEEEHYGNENQFHRINTCPDQFYSEDSGINLSENYCSTLDVTRTEIREVRIYRQTRTGFSRNLSHC